MRIHKTNVEALIICGYRIGHKSSSVRLWVELLLLRIECPSFLGLEEVQGRAGYRSPAGAIIFPVSPVASPKGFQEKAISRLNALAQATKFSEVDEEFNQIPDVPWGKLFDQISRHRGGFGLSDVFHCVLWKG